jgi:hypothetical protein
MPLHVFRPGANLLYLPSCFPHISTNINADTIIDANTSTSEYSLVPISLSHSRGEHARPQPGLPFRNSVEMARLRNCARIAVGDKKSLIFLLFFYYFFKAEVI